MASDKNPGLEALDECEDQVRISIRNDLKEISQFLKKCNVIDKTLYRTIIDPESKEMEENKATMVYLKLTDKVEAGVDVYLEFVGYLRNNSKFKKTVSKLNEAYVKNGGKVSGPNSVKLLELVQPDAYQPFPQLPPSMCVNIPSFPPYPRIYFRMQKYSG